MLYPSFSPSAGVPSPVCSRTADSARPMSFFAWCRLALRACGCDDDRPQHFGGGGSGSGGRSGAPKLKCYYDVSDDLVMRQLAFRKMRKTARDASTNSLSSLGSVNEDLEEALMPVIPTTPDSSLLMAGLSRNGSDARLAPDFVRPITPPGSFKTVLDSR